MMERKFSQLIQPQQANNLKNRSKCHSRKHSNMGYAKIEGKSQKKSFHKSHHCKKSVYQMDTMSQKNLPLRSIKSKTQKSQKKSIKNV